MLAGILIFLSLLIALLAVPVALDFQVTWQREFTNKLQLSWLFGLVRVQTSSRRRVPNFSSKNELDKLKELQGPDITAGHSTIRLVLDKQVRQRVIKYVRDLWCLVEKENIVVHIQAGFDDPADTGQLWAVIGPIAGTLANVKDTSISIEPDFLNASFEFDSSAVLRFNPLRIILISIGFLLSPAIWRGVRQISAGR